MYFDGVILASVATVVAVCVILGYMGVYTYKHVKADGQKAQQERR